ncbi:MAG TPA: FtsX-like permease family protein [Ruminiclostridium sp.]|nr:FtsX-like permease family protein [Ruminiclostridium sp.]
MNSFSIAFKMFKTNLRSYGFYLAVMVFSVAVYYDFMVLKYSPDFLKARAAVQSAQIASSVTSFIMVVFLFFFIWYSSSFFLKQRKKEIAIYTLMGISTRKIGRIFAIESLFSGLASTAAGLGVGILFSRLFLMAVAKVALLKVSIGFVIPLGGIRELLIVFGVIFIMTSANSFVSVSRSKLIDLLKDSSKEETEPKLKLVRAILSIIFIVAGYYLSKNLLMELFVVILVVIGTYWLFGALLPTITKYLSNNKSILYKGVRLISISNISFRIKANYRSLAVLAVMTATTISAFGTSLTLKYYVDETRYINFPYSFSYVMNDSAVNNKVIDTIKSSKHKLLLNEKIGFYKSKDGTAKGTMAVIKYSDFDRLSRNLMKIYPGKISEYKPITGTDALVVIPSGGLNLNVYSYEGKHYVLGDDTCSVVEQIKTPLFGSEGPGMYDCLIVSDLEYGKLSAKYKADIFNGLIVSDAEKSQGIAAQLQKIIPKTAGFSSYASSYEGLYAFMGLFYFLGSFMSIVFILATGSIMYFKILSEGLADKEKYEILKKIGMTRKEIRQAVSMQVGLSLILPLVIGIIHSLFAIDVLRAVLGLSLTVPLLTAIVTFVLFYGVFYVTTTRNFMKMVY